MNVTYDGDAFSGTLTLDQYWAQYSRRLDPHTGVMDMNRPFQVARNLSLTVPMLSTMNHWLRREAEEVLIGSL